VTRTGRRPGTSTTRAAVLAIARRRFAESGYDATSMRAIAAEAGVDTSVIVHFFGSKDGLFRAAVGWPFDPAGLAGDVLTRGKGDLGEGLARTFLSYWDDPGTRPSLLALLRSAMSHETSALLMREFLARQLFAQVAEVLGRPPDPLQVELAAGQLVGLAVLRYGLRIEPIASQTIDELVTSMAPVLNYYLGAGQRMDTLS
jgi:AcrR family transcriptional regulator